MSFVSEVEAPGLNAAFANMSAQEPGSNVLEAETKHKK